ncbi:unnamed protein product [Effrenium voratum]|nr:unnamed protein product [Effrenium voratum]
MAPEPPPSETLFVTGLPMDCTNEYGKQIFAQYGTVKEVTTLPVAAGKTAKAAFIIMETVDDAKWIVENVNGNVPQNLTSPVTVVFATPRAQRPGGAGGKAMGKGMPMKGGMPGMMGMMSMMMNSWGGWGWGGKGGGGKGFNDPGRFKTVMCKFYETQGFCQRGDSCTFAHGAWELGKGGGGKGPAMGGKGPAMGGKGGMMALGGMNGMNGGPPGGKFKTVMCNYFLQGTCTRGASCTYAHGPHELKQ